MLVSTLLQLSSLMLFVSLLHLPYTYYQILRAVVFCSAGWAGVEFSRKEKQTNAVVMFGIAVLFNPIYPIYLSRGVWSIIDVITALVLFLGSLDLKKKSSK